MIQNLKALAFGLLVALLLCEIILRIYNPFSQFTKQGKLVLPANQTAVFENKWIRQLDPKIYYSRNSLGFRGPEPGDSIRKLTSLICIGGSTTECRFLSDDQTWPFLMSHQLKNSIPDLWINNAGIDGHSTFGHLLLVKEYILQLKPRYVLFLTGVNDVETEQPERFDLMNDNRIHISSFKLFLKSVLNQTEIGSTITQLYSIRLAYKKGLIHKEVDFKTLPDTTLAPEVFQRELEKQKSFLSGYQARLQELVSLCKANGITPILLTQPSLYGTYLDSATGIFMSTKYIPIKGNYKNNLLQEEVLEAYNNVVRSFSGQTTVIDLSRRMPKNTDYYYDFIHFNKKGSAKVAALLAEELKTILQQ